MGTYIHTDGPGQDNGDRQPCRWSRTSQCGQTDIQMVPDKTWGQTDIQMVPDKTMGTNRHTDGPGQDNTNRQTYRWSG